MAYDVKWGLGTGCQIKAGKNAFTHVGSMLKFLAREEIEAIALLAEHSGTLAESVQHSTGEAKYWLDPRIELAVNHGLTLRRVREAERIVKEHKDEIWAAWKAHFPKG